MEGVQVTDFGHIAHDVTLGEGKEATRFHVDTWGVGPFRLVAGGQTFLFEDSARFGPLFLGKTGIVLNDQRGGKAFWPAHYMWIKGGRKTDSDLCIWSEPKPGTYWRDAGGTRYFLTDPDYEPMGYVEVRKPEGRG